jgi:hypothetical protein
MNSADIKITHRSVTQERQYLPPSYRTTLGMTWSMNSEGLRQILSVISELPMQFVTETPTSVTNIKGRPLGLPPRLTTTAPLEDELFCCSGKVKVTDPDEDAFAFKTQTASIYDGSPRIGVFSFHLQQNKYPPELPMYSIDDLIGSEAIEVQEIRLGLLFFKSYPAYRFWGENPALAGHILLEANQSEAQLEVRGYSDKKNGELPQLPGDYLAALQRGLRDGVGIDIANCA